MPSDLPDAELAAAIRRLAAERCPGCAWYHGLWPYLRIFGLAAAPDRHAAFYADALGSAARDGAFARVLVSGSADHGMLAHVLAAYSTAGAAPVDVTALDLCPTPTVVCGWYAARVGVGVAAAVSDILTFSPAEPFDLVCTHSFIAQFPPPQRAALVARWRSLLRPGGRAVTVVRIQPGAGAGPTSFSPAQADTFADQVREQAVARAAELGLDPDEMAAAARRFAAGVETYPVRSVGEVEALFHDAGFAIDRLDLTEITGALRGGASGPGSSQTATYAEIVATARPFPRP